MAPGFGTVWEDGEPGAERPVRHCGFSQLIKVSPKRYYLLSCWMKGEGARGWPGARIYTFEYLRDIWEKLEARS